MKKVVFGIILVSCCLPIHTMGTCTAQGSCPTVGYFFALGKNMVDKHSLSEFGIEIVTVSSPNECFRRCRLNCQCISFKYRTTQNRWNCELNAQNRHLKPMSLHPNLNAQDVNSNCTNKVAWHIKGAMSCACFHLFAENCAETVPFFF